jgi:hypothetical protein
MSLIWQEKLTSTFIDRRAVCGKCFALRRKGFSVIAWNCNVFIFPLILR